jgi:AraC-like DNA-binding protein
MGGRANLVDVALDAGYADSTHFSRAVRKCYGYTPSTMFDGSRGLSVIRQWGISSGAR